MRFDRAQFFKGIRSRLLSKMNQRQVDGLEFLLGAFETSREWSSLRHIGYALATVGHETAWTFQPISEYRAKAGTAGRKNQDRYWLTGFYGRGYVQLTWRTNYERAARELGVDLVNRPELALDSKIAFAILTRGMHQGWFTGHKLSTHITAGKTDYVNARRIINGTDKAEQIAGYARTFERILRDAAYAPFEKATDDEIDAATEIPTAEEPRREPHSALLEAYPAAEDHSETTAIPQAEVSTQTAENIVNIGAENPVPENFVAETVAVDAPPPTGFIAKLKWHVASLGIGTGSFAAVKEIFGVQLGAETVDLLKILLPTVLGLGFLGFLVWYVSEKVVGFKTLKMQAEIAADPGKHNVEIKPQ